MLLVMWRFKGCRLECKRQHAFVSQLRYSLSELMEKTAPLLQRQPALAPSSADSRTLPAHHQILPAFFQRKQTGIFDTTRLCLVTNHKTQQLEDFFGGCKGLEMVACCVPKGRKSPISLFVLGAAAFLWRVLSYHLQHFSFPPRQVPMSTRGAEHGTKEQEPRFCRHAKVSAASWL